MDLETSKLHLGRHFVSYDQVYDPLVMVLRIERSYRIRDSDEEGEGVQNDLNNFHRQVRNAIVIMNVGERTNQIGSN